MFKRMVYLYAADEQINSFVIGYMINPSLHINKVFREQVENFLRATFHENTMETVRGVLKDKYTRVIALIFFYDNKGTKPKKCIGC